LRLPEACFEAIPTIDAPPPAEAGPLPWILTEPGLPYFVTERGDAWHPIGQNDAVTWPELKGLFRRQDLPSVERHLTYLKESGVTCLRLMLEYCHGEHRYLERPLGRFVPAMVRFWDDLFALCERVGLHLLLTPLDTFFTWQRWNKHPYNHANGGPCASPTQLLSCRRTREAIKARLAFATERWGASPALFAWDLWNEMHPAMGEHRSDCFADYIDDVAPFLRALEVRLHGRAHLQTVSIFGPELVTRPGLAEPIFRHPALDFANLHLYEEGTIDDPVDTVAPAISTGKLMRSAIEESCDLRPVFDSEHGPIHTFKDRHKTLPEAFDEEYFRHMQWAHLASGGAGGGLRWPNRKPHCLTSGMRRAQRALANFLPLLDWTRLRRRPLDITLLDGHGRLAAFGCGDEDQAVLWLLRTDTIGNDGMLRQDPAPLAAEVIIRSLRPGEYRVTPYDTRAGKPLARPAAARAADGSPRLAAPAIETDLAFALRKL
jgi:hypothetical protein